MTPWGTERRRARTPIPPARVMVLAACCLGIAGATSVSAEDLTTALTRPLSPGAIALLVEQTRDPAVLERLAAGLKDPKPEVRAAAARVVNVSAVRSLLPDIQTALATEPDLGAATELAWALSALAGSAADDELVAAARRLGGRAMGRFALILARSRGPEALLHAGLLTV